MQIKKRITITTAAFGIGIILFAGAIAVPSASRISDLRKSIAIERWKIQQRYDLRSYVRNSLSDIQNAQERLSRIRTIAVHENRELEFVQAIEDVGSRTGVTMALSLATANQKVVSPWERWIPVQISVKGEFPRVMSFLNEVEHLPYYVIFDSLLINGPRTVTVQNTGEVDARFSGRVYWQGKNAPEVLNYEDPGSDLP
jgi:hypothetical protein